MNPSATIILRTKNSADTVRQALVGLFSQSYRDFELLVVDSGSTDSTLTVVDRFPHRLIRIAPTEYFPGVVLNRAAAEARSELLVFWNSDVVPLDHRCLEELLAAFSDPDVMAAFARQVPRPEALAWVRRDYGSSFPPDGPPPPWITLSLPLAAMRKSAWRLHPFYTSSWASEDTEWGYWARRNGLKVVYAPSARVMHSHNYSLRQLYGRRFVEGEADAFIYGERPSLWRLCKRFVSSVLGDWRFALGWRFAAELPMVPIRRAVYHWAHFRGVSHGSRRLARGDGDLRVGQRVVLERY